MLKIQTSKLTLFRAQRPKREIAIIEQLPCELVSRNILSRLPVKDLLKCKSVCKSWFDLITNPYFVTYYYSFYNSLMLQNEPLFVIRELLPLKSSILLLSYNINGHVSSDILNTPSPSEHNSKLKFWIEIMGPCNGIYFLSGCPYMLMNPSLRQFKTLPPRNNNYFPLITYSGFGFGFDSKTNDYKVVVIKHLQSKNWTPPEIYSLNSNSWRNLDASLPLPFQIWDFSEVYTYVNNCCHWWGFVEEGGVRQDVVLAFDMVIEVFRKIKVPRIRDSPEEAFTTLAPFEESGTIGVIVHPVTGDENRFDVWVMKDHGDEASWMKRYIVGQAQVIDNVVGFYGSKQFHWNAIDKRLVRGSKKIKDLEVYGKCCLLRATRYMESLVSLHRGNEFSGQFGSCTMVPDPLLNKPRNFIVNLIRKMKAFLKIR